MTNLEIKALKQALDEIERCKQSFRDSFRKRDNIKNYIELTWEDIFEKNLLGLNEAKAWIEVVLLNIELQK